MRKTRKFIGIAMAGKNWLTTRMGFEPTRAEHIGLAVQRLNHSATSSHYLKGLLKKSRETILCRCSYLCLIVWYNKLVEKKLLCCSCVLVELSYTAESFLFIKYTIYKIWPLWPQSEGNVLIQYSAKRWRLGCMIPPVSWLPLAVGASSHNLFFTF